MACDVYVQIYGVNGESNDDKHKGWIEVEAVDWGVIELTAGTMSTAGGHTIGRPVFDVLRITKAVDLASPS
jgi:type VI secretion system secreted protein Hcp